MHNLHTPGFYSDIAIGRKKIRGRFVIPSGVRCAHASAIERYFGIASIGMITTKSVSFEPRAGYKEPLYVRYAENSYLNAVGLANPGAEVFARELAKITVPENKFLLVSIFGKDPEDFLRTAELLAPYADGFELNMSCPHAKGFGLSVGSDAGLVTRITKAVAERFDVPVFVKLSSVIPDAAKLAGEVMAGGAAGIAVTNSIGPTIEYVGGAPVLSNVVGGMSGEAIRPMGLKLLRDIRAVIGPQPPVIGMGGIFTTGHVESYNTAGADFFGIGSALTNLNTEETEKYLDSLQNELIHQSNTYTLPPVTNMDYRRCVIEKNEALTDALHKLTVSKWEGYGADSDVAGKFFFLMIPGVGEKPFALYSHGDREFIVKNVGFFTNALTSLSVGGEIFVRGPYGKGVWDCRGVTVNFVAGGTGIAPVYEIAKKYNESCKVRFFLGGKMRGDIFGQERYAALGEVHIATEDGSVGAQGYVTGLLEAYPFEEGETQVFINVGPKPMIEKSYAIEKKITGDENIKVSIEYQTSCGVGICGKCASEGGFISCLDGPFLDVGRALKIKECRHG
ncbi:MAG: tRNA-dihydrouridine synthase [Firmicutes bacterium]|nr:tRNA-dihydrouridine synthase [Bacillota bacterium]